MLANLQELREKMEREGFDAILLTSPENIFYVSGYRALEPPTTLSFIILIGELEPILLTPIPEIGSILSTGCWVKDLRFYGRYFIDEAPEQNIVAESSVESIIKVFEEEGFNRGVLGIEEGNISHSIFKKLSASLPQIKLRDASELLYQLRMIKSEEEIDRIRRAVKASEKALMDAFHIVREGITELEISKALKRALIDEGAEWTFIELGAGARSGLPNEQPSDYRVKRGDVIRLDFGAVLNGYCSDISRNAVVGEASERVRRIHEALLKGETTAIEAVKPGVKASEIFRIGQETIRRAGLPNFTRYNLGHGIGLSTHEPPLISPENDELIREGMVFTIEVPYYIYNYGGFNMEDVVLVTEDGYELISTLTHELLVL